MSDVEHRQLLGRLLELLETASIEPGPLTLEQIAAAGFLALALAVEEHASEVTLSVG